MRLLALILFAAAVLPAKENSIGPQEIRDGWILLFDGESLIGWTQDGAGKWKVADGSLSYDAPGSTLLRTTVPFTDYVLRFDFRAADTEKAGDVFLRLPLEGNPAESSYALHHGSELAQITKISSPAPSSGVWHSTEIEWLGDHYVVKLDGRQTTDGKDARSKAGYIALEGKGGTKVEYRNIRLKPLGEKKLFNGSELAGWKSVNASPAKPGGGANPIKKILKIGGGPPKVKEANWSVAAGQIRGTEGPGQLETETLYDDFLLQLELRALGKKKKDPVNAAVFLRGEPGKLFSGYKVENGALSGLKGPRRPVGVGEEFVSETIIARDRHFEIWVNGYPVTEYTDPRADAPSARGGSRTLAGSISLEAPAGEDFAFYRNLNLAVLPKLLGGDMKPGAPPPAPVTDASAKPAPAGSGTGAPATPVPPGIDPASALLQAKEEQRKGKVSALTSQSLQSSDPQRKLQLNQEILTLDPTNMVALQNYNEAKAKIDAASADQQKKTEQQTQQVEKKTKDSAQFTDAMTKGEAAIVSGNLVAASRYLSMAERLSPGNPQVQNLRSRIDSTINFRSRLQYGLTGAGAIALLAAIGLWWRTRGKKVAYLEVTEGMDIGKRYPLDQSVTHIGAVQQDGGAKNEIVVRDLERMVSRFHCEVHNQNGKLFLVDCNSSNGTSLNGKKAEANKPMRLKSGSVVQLGRTCALRLGFEKQKKS